MRRLVAALIVTIPALARAQAEEPAPEAAPPVEATPAPIAATPPAPAIEVKPSPTPTPPAASPSPSSSFAPWPTARLALELELFTTARWIHQPGDDLTDVRLDRGEAGLAVALAPRAAAELRLEAIRSAGEGGALGVDGDSTVVRVKIAQVTGSVDAGSLRLDGALGFVPDPWLRTLEAGYSLRPLSRTASERLLGWPTSDLSAEVRASWGPARLSISAGNGEGLRYPERNSGKTTTAVLEVVAIDARALRLVLAGVGRDGSVGSAAVRDKRVGGGATVLSPRVRAGGEAVRAWGLGDRGEVKGLALAGWAEVTLAPRLALAGRGATLGLAGGGRSSSFGGAVAVDPWRVEHGALRLWLAVERATTSGDASPIVGGATGNATSVFVIASATAPFTLERAP